MINNTGNIHISEEIQKKWVNYSFIGKPFKLKNGRTYCRARSKFFGKIHFYEFETDFFWHDPPLTDTKYLL